jgi:hypothetical protein
MNHIQTFIEHFSQLNSKRFWWWYMTLWTTCFLDFVHRLYCKTMDKVLETSGSRHIPLSQPFRIQLNNRYGPGIYSCFNTIKTMDTSPRNKWFTTFIFKLIISTNKCTKTSFVTVFFIERVPQYAFRQLYCHHQGAF